MWVDDGRDEYVPIECCAVVATHTADKIIIRKQHTFFLFSIRKIRRPGLIDMD